MAATLTELLFVGLVGLMAVIFLIGSVAAFRTELSRSLWLVAVVIVIDVMLVIPGFLAYLGLLDRYNTVPPVALLPVVATTICTVVLAMSPIGERFARLPLAGLVIYQAFRIPVEYLLHRLFLEGVIPVQMTFDGRNFDIVSGLTGLLLGLWLLKRPVPTLVVTLWNCLGLALLANIVEVAVLSAPVPFRTFLNEPANRLPGLFPYVWLPTFLVQAALFGHLIVFRALGRRSG